MGHIETVGGPHVPPMPPVAYPWARVTSNSILHRTVDVDLLREPEAGGTIGATLACVLLRYLAKNSAFGLLDLFGSICFHTLHKVNSGHSGGKPRLFVLKLPRVQFM